jgi:F-type H+-transporting ATPase subunit b
MADLQLANVPPPEAPPTSTAPIPADQPPGAPDAPAVDDTHAGTEVEGHGAKPGLPQLDTTTFASQLFWLLISFIVLYLVISRIAAPKIGGVIADRAGRIKGDLDTAAEAKRASEAALANYEKALADARARALKLGDEIRRQVLDEANLKSETAAKQLAADTQKAEARIAELRTAAMARVGDVARETAADIIAKLTAESVPASDLDAAVRAALKRT